MPPTYRPRILRDMLDTLPDEQHDDLFWTIRQLVKRRDSLIKGIIIAKNQLNAQLTYVYPSYKQYFCDVDTKTAMYFWEVPTSQASERCTAGSVTGGITAGA